MTTCDNFDRVLSPIPSTASARRVWRPLDLDAQRGKRPSDASPQDQAAPRPLRFALAGPGRGQPEFGRIDVALGLLGLSGVGKRQPQTHQGQGHAKAS